jgi:carbamoyltransferase
MRVLGISAFFHDAAAALVEDGRIVAAAQEERFSRLKHDAGMPLAAARFCLEQAGVGIDDIDHVVFYEKPLRKFERILVGHLREFPLGVGQFARSLAHWLPKRLWTQAEISSALGCDPSRVLFSDHHMSHAASAFLASPFERAAVLTIDGVGEWATTTIYRAETTEGGSSIEPLVELHFPHSIGLLYSAITAYLGFEVNEGEYKVMGLSAYGEPRFLEEFERLARVDDDGSLTVDRRFFAYQRDPEKSFTPALEELLGPARRPGAALELPSDDSEARRFADVAASLQAFTERYLLTLARRAHALTGERNLCLAGGVALNSVANRKIAQEGPFDRLFVQPAAGDAGGALGAALWATHVVHGLPRRGPMADAMLGAAYDEREVERFLVDCKVPHRAFATTEELCAEVAQRLARSEVGGWFQGRFEWGPRALGNRSILADARDVSMRDRVNRKVKFREPFRPFAPAALVDEAPRWFQIPDGKLDELLPYMCAVVPVTDEGRAALPAITHVDGTARLQTVDRDRNPRFFELLEAFRDLTGVGVLMNTSMNLKDEPICASPAEAYGTFVRSDLDFLVLEKCLVEKRP